MGLGVGILIHRTGHYLLFMWIGTTLLTLGVGLFIDFGASTSLVQIILVTLIPGLGAGNLFEPPLIALQAFVHQDDVATATATFGFIRTLSSAISIVVGGVLFQNGMRSRAGTLITAGVPASVVAALGEQAAASVPLIQTLTEPAQVLAVKNAFAESMRNMWILYTGLGVVGVVACVFLRGKVLSGEHTETRTGIKDEKERLKVVTGDETAVVAARPAVDGIEVQRFGGISS